MEKSLILLLIWCFWYHFLSDFMLIMPTLQFIVRPVLLSCCRCGGVNCQNSITSPRVRYSKSKLPMSNQCEKQDFYVFLTGI